MSDYASADLLLAAIDRAAADSAFAAEGGATLGGVIAHRIGLNARSAAMTDLRRDLDALRGAGLAERRAWGADITWSLTPRGHARLADVGVEGAYAALPDRPADEPDAAATLDALAMLPDMRVRAASLAAAIAQGAAHGGADAIASLNVNEIEDLREALLMIQGALALAGQRERPKAAVLDLGSARDRRDARAAREQRAAEGM